MEENKERVFAYTLATVIDHEDMEKVSGGSSQMTGTSTSRVTGGSGQGVDVAIDVSVDW